MPIRQGLFQGSFPPDLPMVDCIQKTSVFGFDGLEITMEDPEPLLQEALNDHTQEILAIGKSVGLSTKRPGSINIHSTSRDIEFVAGLARKEGIAVHSIATMMLFFYPLSSPVRVVRDYGINIVRSMLNAASILNAETVLIVPGVVTPAAGYRDVYDRARDVIRDLASEAAHLGVTIAVENVWNRFLYSPLEMARFLDEVGSSSVGAYLDVANVLPFGFPEDWLRILSGRVKGIHFKDFRTDVGTISGFSHLLYGDVNWVSVVDAIQEINYQGYITAEVAPLKFFPDKGLRDTKTSLDLLLNRV